MRKKNHLLVTNFNLHTPFFLPLEGQGLGGGVYIWGRFCDILDETLVDTHLVEIPGLGTLTARGLTGGDLEVLGGQTDGALDGQVLALGALDELGADLLESLDLAGGQGDTDLVGLLYNMNCLYISILFQSRQRPSLLA